MATRALEVEEFRQIMQLLSKGFRVNGTGARFLPNAKVALALQLQANLGLRIGDVLSLRVSSFRNGKLELREEKTGKLQYRKVNPYVVEAVMRRVIAKKLGEKDFILDIKVRAVQKQLKIIVDHLGLENISTHSFRKMYATEIYEKSNHNIQLLKELLNHTSVATTQRYIRVSQKDIDEASESINFM